MDSDKIALVAGYLVTPPALMEGDAALRWNALEASRSGPIYRPLIRAELEALMAPVVVAPSEAEARRAANAEHDDYGRATRFACLGVLADPGASAEAKRAAATVLATFVPSAHELVLDTASEVANARRRAPLLPDHAADLARVPAADGRTAHDLLTAMVEVAERRARLTDQRGATAPPNPKDGARWLRIWGLMNEFRGVLAREVAANPALPQNLDQLCFGALDQI